MAKLYEYQAKELLRRNGIMVPRGKLVANPAEAAVAAEEIGFPVAIKAQVLTGGRGKAGGVRFASSATEAKAVAAEMLGATVRGLPVKTVLVEEKVALQQEAYLAVLTNSSLGRPSVLVSMQGGVDIENLVPFDPGKIARGDVDILRGLTDYDARNTVRKAGATKDAVVSLGDLLNRLYRVYRQYDCKLAEINPVALTRQGVVALDARIDVDDDALFRQKDIPIPPGEETGERPPTPLEIAAGTIDLGDHRGTVHFVQIDPDGSLTARESKVPIGFDCVGTGASLTTMDEVVPLGYFPVNFCDTSGNPTASKLYRATRIIFAQPHIKGYLFVSCVSSQQLDNTARGIIKALKEIYPGTGGKPDIPCLLVFRGSWDDEAIELFQRHGISDSPLVRVLGRDCTERDAALAFDSLYRGLGDGPEGGVADGAIGL